jgi:multicomponent Na+:H+ antiporter subunit B
VSRRGRLAVLGVGLAGVAVLLGVALAHLPSSGTAAHPYRDAAVAASVAHGTANVISSINFDQRALDTLGEESILFGSVLAVGALLRPGDDERVRPPRDSRGPLEVTRLGGYVLLPLTLVVGADVVAHGAITPGGGFQGGVVLATGLHLLYVAGQYRSMQELRPMPLVETSEAAGTAAFAALGFAGMGGTGSFLANFLPMGSFGQLLAAGAVPLFNVAVGLAVASGCVVMLAKFFEQVFLVQKAGDSTKNSAKNGEGS